uniref:Uncharacterized protein n=1 Tax=Globodera rostochiensis TaxID=31243 RepID=A0A914I0W9_GLORO
MRLLDNYRRAMAKSSSDTERLSGRLAADVSVWMNHLSEQFSQRKPPPSPSVSVPSASAPAPTSPLSPFSELVNYVWLSFRIIYDICDPTIVMNSNYDFNYKRLSLFLNNYLYEFDNFIQNERKKKRFTDVLKNWKANEHSVLCISDLGWLNEDDNKSAAPLELTQQIHFEVLQKYMDDKEIGKDFREIFLGFPYFIQIGAIILPVSVSKTVGENNKNHEEKYRRKNLLQFLKIENIKKLFELHKITYNESDFMGNESEEEAENVKKMEENPSESDKNAVENVKKLDDVSSVNAAKSQQIMGKNDQSFENIQNIEENLSDSKERPFNIVLVQKNAVNFVEKYNNSIVFNCVAEDKISYDKFCNFVEEQIRSEFTALMEKIGIKNSKEVAFLNTESYKETCGVAKELVQEKFRVVRDRF